MIDFRDTKVGEKYTGTADCPEGIDGVAFTLTARREITIDGDDGGMLAYEADLATDAGMATKVFTPFDVVRKF